MPVRSHSVLRKRIFKAWWYQPRVYLKSTLEEYKNQTSTLIKPIALLANVIYSFLEGTQKKTHIGQHITKKMKKKHPATGCTLTYSTLSVHWSRLVLREKLLTVCMWYWGLCVDRAPRGSTWLMRCRWRPAHASVVPPPQSFLYNKPSN